MEATRELISLPVAPPNFSQGTTATPSRFTSSLRHFVLLNTLFPPYLYAVCLTIQDHLSHPLAFTYPGLLYTAASPVTRLHRDPTSDLVRDGFPRSGPSATAVSVGEVAGFFPVFGKLCELPEQTAAHMRCSGSSQLEVPENPIAPDAAARLRWPGLVLPSPMHTQGSCNFTEDGQT